MSPSAVDDDSNIGKGSQHAGQDRKPTELRQPRRNVRPGMKDPVEIDEQDSHGQAYLDRQACVHSQIW